MIMAQKKLNKRKLFASLRVCKLAAEAGYNEMEENAYLRYSRVTSYARKKYGDLSDDGFYELTTDMGGPEPFEKIYSPKYTLCTRYPGRNFEYVKEEIDAFAAPTIEKLAMWLRENYDTNVHVEKCVGGLWRYCVENNGHTGDFALRSENYFKDYFVAYNKGLADVLKELIKFKKKQFKNQSKV